MSLKKTLIARNLSRVRNILCIASGKGGVGKTLFSCASALSLRDFGYKVGLLDLDIHCPSCHIFLGVKEMRIIEDRGILPLEHRDIFFFSPAVIVGDKALPLRGGYVSEALQEIMSVVRWGELDFLVIDTPPGTGDVLLDIVRLCKDPKFVIITTPAKASVSAAFKTAKIVGDRALGYVVNMGKGPLDINLRYLGSIPYISGLDDEIEIKGIEHTAFYRYSTAIVHKIVETLQDTN